MKARMRVYLNDERGSVVSGKSEETTEEEFNSAKEAIGEIFQSSGGWQVSVVAENGSWACFPKQSVLYVEFEVQ